MIPILLLVIVIGSFIIAKVAYKQHRRFSQVMHCIGILAMLLTISIFVWFSMNPAD